MGAPIILESLRLFNQPSVCCIYWCLFTFKAWLFLRKLEQALYGTDKANNPSSLSLGFMSCTRWVGRRLWIGVKQHKNIDTFLFDSHDYAERFRSSIATDNTSLHIDKLGRTSKVLRDFPYYFYIDNGKCLSYVNEGNSPKKTAAVVYELSQWEVGLQILCPDNSDRPEIQELACKTNRVFTSSYTRHVKRWPRFLSKALDCCQHTICRNSNFLPMKYLYRTFFLLCSCEHLRKFLSLTRSYILVLTVTASAANYKC